MGWTEKEQKAFLRKEKAEKKLKARKNRFSTLKRKYAPAVKFAKTYTYKGDNQDEVAMDALDLLRMKLADMEDEVIEEYPSVIGKPIIKILSTIQGELEDLIEYHDNRL